MTIAVGLVTLSGAMLRWLSPGRGGLWRDEAQFLAIVSLPSPTAVYRFLAEHESHPPLYYWIGQAVGHLTGSAEAGMSALSLATSVATIPLVAVVGVRTSGALSGIFAAALVAVSASVALFSVQVRPYAFLSVLWILSVWALNELWAGGSRRWLVLWVVASAVALWTHHATLVLIVAEAIVIVGAAMRGPRPGALSRIAMGAGTIALLWIPLAPLFVEQLASTSYPSVTPMEGLTPWRQLASLLLQYPLELVLPIVSLAILGLASSHSRVAGVRLILAVALAFLLLAAIGTYRSQLLVPHLLLAFAPIGIAGVGGAVALLVEGRRRVAAAVLAEVAVLCVVLGFIFSRGVRKSNTQEVAELLRSRAGASDLVLVSPGYLGVSFNRYFNGPQSQINYPAVGRQLLYPFDHHFERLADTVALRAMTDSVESAVHAGRRVWLVAPGSWLRPSARAPVVLRADSFGGLSQAERSRTNFIHRYLVARAGAPTWTAGDSGAGMEVLALMRFGTSSSDRD